MSAVGLDGGDPETDNEIVYLTAFDNSGILIGSSNFSSDFAYPNIKPITFSSGSANIKSIAFTWTNDGGFYLVDNVSYTSTPTPEPATMLLMVFGSGIMGAGIRRLRKKKRD